MTNDYLVLGCIDIILCVSRSEIDAKNEFHYIEKLHEKPQIKVKVINMNEMFDSDAIKAGINIDITNNIQLNSTERVKTRKNVI